MYFQVCFMKYNVDLKGNFYAPRSNDQGHIVDTMFLPCLSVVNFNI